MQRQQAETAFDTLDYFDGVSFARRATAPTLFSVALMDAICPPSTIFAAYNAYQGEKDIEVYTYNNHEGGGTLQETAQVKWLAERGL